MLAELVGTMAHAVRKVQRAQAAEKKEQQALDFHNAFGVKSGLKLSVAAHQVCP